MYRMKSNSKLRHLPRPCTHAHPNARMHVLMHTTINSGDREENLMVVQMSDDPREVPCFPRCKNGFYCSDLETNNSDESDT